jgi:hypothetical protein
MINYEVDPGLVLHRAPRGTILDLWQGRCVVSLVGFLFGETRVKGIPVPFHRHFEEVNLRYYIQRKTSLETKRAVGFVREIVPQRAVAWMARLLFNENYVALPMDHRIDLESGPTYHAFPKIREPVRLEGRVEYGWKEGGRRHFLAATRASEWEPLKPGSEEEFIAEHYWGYVAQRDGATVEYQVVHPPWRISRVKEVRVEIDWSMVYGAEWREPLSRPPVSAFLAEGSEVSVMDGHRILTA